MEKYIINKKTLAIIPVAKNRSYVIEQNINYFINKNSTSIIDDSCKYYGSSLLGRCEATAYLTGVKYKCPIIISEIHKIIMFPTTSYKNEDCIWINYNGIEKYYVDKSNKLYVELINNKKIEINISNRVISNQIFKSSRLDSILKGKNH